jgi:hypothetical protein
VQDLAVAVEQQDVEVLVRRIDAGADLRRQCGRVAGALPLVFEAQCNLSTCAMVRSSSSAYWRASVLASRSALARSSLRSSASIDDMTSHAAAPSSTARQGQMSSSFRLRVSVAGRRFTIGTCGTSGGSASLAAGG